MTIYGVAILAACLIIGDICGRVIGRLMGIDANVGGVGIAMLLLLALLGRQNSKIGADKGVRSGVEFWSAMYIPIVVAMASIQNVSAAISGGAVAVAAGLSAVVLSILLVPVLSRAARSEQ